MKRLAFMAPAILAVHAAALFAVTLAHADESLTLSGVFEDGNCAAPAAGGEWEYQSTTSVTAEYRRSAPDWDVNAFARSAPTAPDCTQSGLTFDIGVQRKWDLGRLYTFTEFGASKHVISQGFTENADGSGGVAYLFDGTPVYTAAAGVGRAFGPFSAELSGNLVKTPFTDGDRNAVRAALAYEAEHFGVGVRIEASTDHGKRQSYVAQLTRGFENSPLGIVVTLRRDDGLLNLRDPFAGREAPAGYPHQAIGPRDTVTSFEVGISLPF